jgi:fructose-1,6-bisphosphatase/inositol monophosphatase family enzyme
VDHRLFVHLRSVAGRCKPALSCVLGRGHGSAIVRSLRPWIAWFSRPSATHDQSSSLGSRSVSVSHLRGGGHRRDRRARRRPQGGLLSDDLALAERAARDAGGLLLERFGKPARGLGSKSTATDPVSDADRDAEALIRDLLARERPADGLLAEEGTDERGQSGRRWVFDPLDGTVSYLYGYPHWCVSVALEDDAGAVLGIVYDPNRDELFAAERGRGATLGGEPIAVRDPAPLERALVATGFGYDAGRRARQATVARDLLPRVRDIRRAGSAALDLSLLAAGRLDAYYERGLNPWDWAAGSLIVREAGGVVEDLPGEPHGLIAGPAPLVAALRPHVES